MMVGNKGYGGVAPLFGNEFFAAYLPFVFYYKILVKITYFYITNKGNQGEQLHCKKIDKNEIMAKIPLHVKADRKLKDKNQQRWLNWMNQKNWGNKPIKLWQTAGCKKKENCGKYQESPFSASAYR